MEKEQNVEVMQSTQSAPHKSPELVKEMEKARLERRVLIVEDTERHLETARLLAKTPGLQVDIAENFGSAVSLLRRSVQQGTIYDAVMTDFLLPYGRYTDLNAAFSDQAEYSREHGLGLYVALCAKALGVPRVAVVSQQNHHASAAYKALEDVANVYSEASDSSLPALQEIVFACPLLVKRKDGTYEPIEEVYGKMSEARSASTKRGGAEILDAYEKHVMDNDITDETKWCIDSKKIKKRMRSFISENPQYLKLKNADFLTIAVVESAIQEYESIKNGRPENYPAVDFSSIMLNRLHDIIRIEEERVVFGSFTSL
jgi:CheY-like chemotaxis protein